MAIQVGTVDGLLNIGPKITECFVKAISSFEKEGLLYAKERGISVGAAFQRYAYPVYSGQATVYNVKNIEQEVSTKSGKEQSPAYVTYCKKMGLLDTDDAGSYFQLTELGEKLLQQEITLQEYAFILLSKQGIFVNGIYQRSFLSSICELLKQKSVISERELREYFVSAYNDESIIKTRIDILLGAMSAAGLLYRINNQYVLANIIAATILKDFASNENHFSKALLDNDPNYANYIGSYKYGVFDILNHSNIFLYRLLYPHLNIVLKEGSRQL